MRMCRALGATAVVLLALTSCGGDGGFFGGPDADQTAPSVNRFELISPTPTSRAEVLFELDASDDEGVAAFAVWESDSPPTEADAAWTTERPDRFVLDGSLPVGERAISAWARDAAGNVSDRATIVVDYRGPGAELWSVTWDADAATPATARDLAIAEDGSIVVVGSSTGGATALDWRVARFAAADGTRDGSFNLTFDGDSADDVATAVTIGPSGETYVGGTTVRGGQSDIWIKRINADGNEVAAGTGWPEAGWDKVIDHGGEDELGDLFVDGSGNLLVAASAEDLWAISQTPPPSGSGLDWWLTTFLGDGRQNSDWTDQIFHASAEDRALAIAPQSQTLPDATRGIYFAGEATQLVNPSSASDWWVRKFTSRGAEITEAAWPLALDLGTGSNDQLLAAVVDADGALYLGGSTDGRWTIRVYADDDETPEWSVVGPEEELGEVRALAVDAWGNVYAGGLLTSNNQGFIRRFAPDGTEDVSGWPKTLAAGSAVNALAPLADGSLIAIGSASGKWLVSRYFDDRP